ncbi:reverse transcriptase domain-containing protein [Tanacetum coccineum]
MNYIQQPMQNHKDILDPTTAIDMALIAQPGMNMDQDRHMLIVEDNVGNMFRPNVGQTIANQSGKGNVVAARAEGNGNGNNENKIRCYNCQGVDHYARNCTVKPRKKDAAYLQTQLAYDEIEEVIVNCTLKDNLQQASTSGTQTDKAPVYDSDGSAEVHHYENCYYNDIFNMFTKEEHYTELLEPISEPHQVQHNDDNVIFAVSSVE